MSMGEIDGVPPYVPHQKLQGLVFVRCLQCRRQACLIQLIHWFMVRWCPRMDIK